MKNVSVVISTYNGSNRIINQLDSIFSQEDVEVQCYVRDDGSTDNTLEILEEYKKKQPNLIISPEKNVGWQKSFLLALCNAPTADYYAFSDQDDIWFKDKLKKSVEELEKYNKNIPQLFHCNRISCNEELIPNVKQAPKVPTPLSRENAVTQEFAQGCTIVINNKARDLVCRCIPNGKIPHDFWTGLICYYFGEIHYSNEALFFHINHGDNASGAGHIRRSQIGRLKTFFSKKAYPNIANDLLENYRDLLDEDKFLITLRDYKKDFRNRLALLFNKKFCRVNKAGTIALKIALLMNKIG